jgi:hypothetical protein
MFAPIASKKLKAGESVTWVVSTFIPGLISAPGALLFSTSPCKGKG